MKRHAAAADLKRRLAAGRVAVGGWITIGHALVAEALVSTGAFSWAALDLEHAPIGDDAAATIFSISDAHGVAPMVRLSSHDGVQARRMLDLGAAGVIVPMTETADEMEAIGRHLFYPPRGSRGVCLSRANGWGETFQEYLDTFDPVAVAQIESARGVHNAAAIAALPWVDALFLGPYDLSASLGKPGDFQSAEYRAALATVLDAARTHNKPIGIHVTQPDTAVLENRIAEGYRFVAFATDMICLRSATAGLKDLASRHQA